MEQIRDVKPLFDWAVKNGEAKIADRILVKTLPQFLKANQTITIERIQTAGAIEVSLELYEVVKTTAEELIGSSYQS